MLQGLFIHKFFSLPSSVFFVPFGAKHINDSGRSRLFQRTGEYFRFLLGKNNSAFKYLLEVKIKIRKKLQLKAFSN